MMGMLVKGLGADHVVWGTDAVWTGSPQWQIEALRRLEIPGGDAEASTASRRSGAADGPVKRAIFGENSARLYKYDRRAELADRPHRAGEGRLRARGPGTHQPAVRLHAAGIPGLENANGRPVRTGRPPRPDATGQTPGIALLSLNSR